MQGWVWVKGPQSRGQVVVTCHYQTRVQLHVLQNNTPVVTCAAISSRATIGLSRMSRFDCNSVVQVQGCMWSCGCGVRTGHVYHSCFFDTMSGVWISAVVNLKGTVSDSRIYPNAPARERQRPTFVCFLCHNRHSTNVPRSGEEDILLLPPWSSLSHCDVTKNAQLKCETPR